MVQVILTNQSRQQLVSLQNSANVVWRKALNSQGFAQLDLYLTDPYATPQYINPANYLHIFDDNDDSTNFSNARWGGPLVNDFEVKPKDGIVTIQAAGMANLLEMTVVANTQTYTNQHISDVILGILQAGDNWNALNLTAFSVIPINVTVSTFVAGAGDSVLEDIYKLCQDYAVDFEVRPDWSYAIYQRQGVDQPNYVTRYGDLGNIQVDSTMKLVNTELANQVTFVDNSNDFAFVVNQTSVNYYGPKSILIQDGDTYAQYDALTKAQLYAARAAFPLNVLDNIVLIDSSLLPFYLLEVGDRVVFETPSLPLLGIFQGMQRILAAEYNERRQTMTLTMGNAIYKVIKNHIHEVRLYS